MWLEGSDGLGMTDEYSDVDIWFDTNDDYAEKFLEECVAELGRLSEIDHILHERRPSHPFIFQTNLHLKNSSPFLMIDLCVQKHSRERAATIFIEGDIAELPQVIFDKENIISLKQPEPLSVEESRKIIDRQSAIFSERSRVTRFIKRQKFIEAFAKFQEYMIEPIIALARLTHTPRIWNYGTCHISRHLPPDEVKEIGRLFQNKDMNDLIKNVESAEKLFEKYVKQIANENNVGTAF
jgi:hypothetical protein